MFVYSTGTDEDALINVLCYRSNPQRQEIRSAFKTMFGKVSFSYNCIHSNTLAFSYKCPLSNL